jgi:hypothetical protein
MKYIMAILFQILPKSPKQYYSLFCSCFHESMNHIVIKVSVHYLLLRFHEKILSFSEMGLYIPSCPYEVSGYRSVILMMCFLSPHGDFTP